jgi:hypothetical protein
VLVGEREDAFAGVGGADPEVVRTTGVISTCAARCATGSRRSSSLNGASTNANDGLKGSAATVPPYHVD